MQINSLHHKLFHLQFVLLNLQSVERERKNYKNLNISRTKRDEIKKHFSVFEGLLFGEKIKI